MKSCISCTARWNIADPDLLSYDKDASSVDIVVVQRKVEMPSEKELYRITLSVGGIFKNKKAERAVRVQRCNRGALDSISLQCFYLASLCVYTC